MTSITGVLEAFFGVNVCVCVRACVCHCVCLGVCCGKNVGHHGWQTKESFDSATTGKPENSKIYLFL